MREALSGTSSQCFTVSPALISIFGGCGLVGVGCVCFGVLVVCWFVFVFVSFSPTSEIF